MQESHAHYIAIKIAGPVHHEGFDRSFRFGFKSGPRANVRNTAPPFAFNQGGGDVNAVKRDHAVARMKIRGREAQLCTTLCTANDAPFDAIRPAQHASREIHSTLIQQFADTGRTDASLTKTHLSDLVGKKSEILADASQEVDVSSAVVTESKTSAEIDFLGMQTIDDHVAQEIFGADLGE